MAAASIAVLTRYLGPGDYGRFTLALMYVQLFAVLADAGLLMTVVRDISKRPERTEELVGNTLVLRGVLWFAVIALAGLVSLALPYSQDVRVAILLAGGPLLFGLLNTSLVAVFQARLRMSRAVISEVVGRAAGLALTISVAALDLGFYAVMGAAAGGALVSLVVTWLLVRGLVPIRPLAEPAVWRRLLRASIPLGLALAINELYFRADTLIISLSRSYEDVGLYTLAFRMLEFTLPLGAVFLTTVFPVMSRDVAEGERRAAATIQGAWDVMVAFAVPLAAGGALLAPEIVAVIGGGGLRRLGHPAADPARGRGPGARQRDLRAGADREGAPGRRAVAERDRPRVQRGPEPRAGAHVRHSGRSNRDRGLGDPDPRGLLSAHAPLPGLLPEPRDAGRGAGGGRRDGRRAVPPARRPAGRDAAAGSRRLRRGSLRGQRADTRRGGGPSRLMLPRGPRDSRSWYLDADPLAQVDRRLVEFADAHAGHSVLDLGCGLGGYSLALAERGREVRALDVSEEYVERARASGWPPRPTTASGSRSRTGAWTR